MVVLIPVHKAVHYSEERQYVEVGYGLASSSPTACVLTTSLEDPSMSGWGSTQTDKKFWFLFYLEYTKQMSVTNIKMLKPEYLNVSLFQPDVIVHCAAERRPDVVERHTDAAVNLNVHATSTLAKEAGG